MSLHTIIEIRMSQEEHLMLMLHLLKHRTIIKASIQSYKETGREVPGQWVERLNEIETLIQACKE